MSGQLHDNMRDCAGEAVGRLQDQKISGEAPAVARPVRHLQGDDMDKSPVKSTTLLLEPLL